MSLNIGFESPTVSLFCENIHCNLQKIWLGTLVIVYLSSSQNDDLLVKTEAEEDVLINSCLDCIIVYWKWDKED